MIRLKHLAIGLLTFSLSSQALFASPTTYETKSCPNNNPYHLLVNKKQGIPRDFIPENLVVPNVKFSFSGYHEKKQLEPTTAKALEALFAGAQKDGMTLAAVSGYRSYDRQAQIYNNYVARDGQTKADTYSARPGTSEHQTGLAMDVSAPSVGYSLSSQLGNTKEGKWLQDNAHRYGFIIRYPQGKESITGYMYEPWHLRYVGETLATTLYTSGLTFEELDTCCEALPATPLTPAQSTTPVVTDITKPNTLPLANALAQTIEVLVDKSLQDLSVTIVEDSDILKIIIQPKTPVTTLTPTTGETITTMPENDVPTTN